MAPTKKKCAAAASVLLNLCSIYVTLTQKVKKRKRKVWVQESLQQRCVFGIQESLLKDLLIESGDGFKFFLSMEHNTFSMLYSWVNFI